jgi:hypothetical protein
MASGPLTAKLLHLDLTARPSRVEERTTASKLAELGLTDVKA